MRFHLLQAQPVLGPGDLRAVRGADHGVQLGSEVADAGPHALELLGPLGRRRLGRGPPGHGLGHGSLRGGHGQPGTVGHRARHDRLRGALPEAGLRPLTGLALGRRRRGQRACPPLDGAEPFFHGADLEAGLHLGVARHGAPLRQRLLDGCRRAASRRAAGGVPSRVRGVRAFLGESGGPFGGFGLREAAGELGQPGEVLLGRLAGGVDRLFQPPYLVTGGPGRSGEPAEAAGDLGGGRVGLAHPDPGLVHRAARGFLGTDGYRKPLSGLFALFLGLFQAGGRAVGGRPYLQQALLPGRAAGRPVRAQQVPVPGDHAQGRAGAQQVGRLLQAGGHDHPGQQLGDGRPELVGRLDEVQGIPGARRQPRARGRAAGGP